MQLRLRDKGFLAPPPPPAPCRRALRFGWAVGPGMEDHVLGAAKKKVFPGPL